MKIIVAEKISSSAVAQLQEPGWTVLTADQLDGKLAEHLETADALIVRSAVQADAKLLSHEKKFDPGQEFGPLGRFRHLVQGSTALSFYRLRSGAEVVA